jgi:hypothetical protein
MSATRGYRNRNQDEMREGRQEVKTAQGPWEAEGPEALSHRRVQPLILVVLVVRRPWS